ncbi:MAG TPA: hypothetical protein VFR86_02005 [Burkholderiaceae bacterium]|nr:hypothetical protein [Burkholderiaceae bacterium]
MRAGHLGSAHADQTSTERRRFADNSRRAFSYARAQIGLRRRNVPAAAAGRGAVKLQIVSELSNPLAKESQAKKMNPVPISVPKLTATSLALLLSTAAGAAHADVKQHSLDRAGSNFDDIRFVSAGTRMKF